MPPEDDDPADEVRTLGRPAPAPSLGMSIDDLTQAETISSRHPTLPSARTTRLSLSDYQLGTLLGRGGMGDVMLARDKTIGRDVALKQLRLDQPSPEAVARFLREARIQARLDHPAIVPVHQLGQDADGRPYFTMKRLTGTTLAKQLAAATTPRQRVLRQFTEVCRAIEFAHARGVVHRDLKPPNIMIGDFGEVYVLDWGLARLVGDRETRAIGEDVPSLDDMTQAGTMLGTPGYMAPEQIEDATTAGPAADIYALGSMLFQILAGTALHPRGPSCLTSTLRGVIEGPAQRAPGRDVPPELDVLCLRALATRPEDRPTARELADRLEGYLDGDRDHERRRALAATFVRRARAALASADERSRATAMQAAGRALVLDPESTDAAAIVSELMFTPTFEHPPELRAELTASEVTVQRRQGGVAVRSFGVVLAFLAFASLNGLADLPLVAAIAVYTIGLAVVVWRVTRGPARPWQFLAIATGNALLAALLSRTFGSMIIVPAVTCIMAVSLTSYPQLIDRRAFVIGLLVTSWLAPVALEAMNVLAPTWQVEAGVVHLTTQVMTLGGAHTTAILVGSNVVTIVVIGLFASALARSRRDALRQTEIHAWHLRQLLPSSA